MGGEGGFGWRATRLKNQAIIQHTSAYPLLYLVAAAEGKGEGDDSTSKILTYSFG